MSLIICYLLIIASLLYTDCTRQCMESFGKDITFDQALSCMDDVPDQLHGHEATKALQLKAIQIISDKLVEMVSEEDSDDEEKEQSEEKNRRS